MGKAVKPCRVRVFTFNHYLCRRGDGGTGPKKTGVRVGQSPGWAMPRSCPRWASGPDGRVMDKADRSQSGGGFRRLAEVPKETWGLEECRTLSKALTSDLPDCPPACQAGDKHVRRGSLHLRPSCRSAIKPASPPASCGSSAPTLPLLGDGGALISGRTLMRAVRGTLNLLRAGN